MIARVQRPGSRSDPEFLERTETAERVTHRGEQLQPVRPYLLVIHHHVNVIEEPVEWLLHLQKSEKCRLQFAACFPEVGHRSLTEVPGLEPAPGERQQLLRPLAGSGQRCGKFLLLRPCSSPLSTPSAAVTPLVMLATRLYSSASSANSSVRIRPASRCARRLAAITGVSPALARMTDRQPSSCSSALTRSHTNGGFLYVLVLISIVSPRASATGSSSAREWPASRTR